MSTKEYLVVLPITPMPVGTMYQKGEQLPLHCTLMPWFELPLFYFQQLEGRLSYLASGVVDGTIELQSERFRYFGAKKNIRVHALSPHSMLLYMHVMLLRLLTRMEFLPRDTAVGWERVSATRDMRARDSISSRPLFYG